MKHALIVATIGGFITSFEKNDIKILQEKGYHVHVACDVQDKKRRLEELGVTLHPISFARSPLSRKNIAAYRQLKLVMQETDFDLVHCHTPVGGVLARLAARKYRKKGLKVIYTAHGFHFFNGASKKNWMIFYPVERMLAHCTDVLITINKEDYERARKQFKAGRVAYVPGIGLDLHKFCPKGLREKVREQLGCQPSTILMLSVGELSKRKNHELVIRAMKKAGNENLQYVIAGQGSLEEELRQLIRQLQLDGQVRLIGQRDDIADLCEAADIYAFPSRQEGLPVALMEAMAMGLPCVASKIRGNVDLLEQGNGCFLCGIQDETEFAEAIGKLASDEKLRTAFGHENRKRIEAFSKEVVEVHMREIYDGIE